MEMKTLSLLISFFLKESKGFNFQAFKVILNSINISNKTSIFKLAILWSVMEEKETWKRWGQEKNEDTRKTGT